MPEGNSFFSGFEYDGEIAWYDEYARALSTYGRQAEQLAQAGLTNSGVSDNVQRAAYAQKQTALQNAQALKNQTEATNRSQYAAYVDTKEAQLEAEEKAEADAFHDPEYEDESEDFDEDAEYSEDEDEEEGFGMSMGT